MLKLGNGAEYVVSAYPVAVQTLDIIVVVVIVLALGILSSWIPARKSVGG
jgi:ABC-type lipoprotein release transport system permease subunit